MKLSLLRQPTSNEPLIAKIDEICNFGCGDIVIVKDTDYDKENFMACEVIAIADFDDESEIEFLSLASGIDINEFCEIVGVGDGIDIC